MCLLSFVLYLCAPGSWKLEVRSAARTHKPEGPTKNGNPACSSKARADSTTMPPSYLPLCPRRPRRLRHRRTCPRCRRPRRRRRPPPPPRRGWRAPGGEDSCPATLTTLARCLCSTASDAAMQRRCRQCRLSCSRWRRTWSGCRDPCSSSSSCGGGGGGCSGACLVSLRAQGNKLWQTKSRTPAPMSRDSAAAASARLPPFPLLQLLCARTGWRWWCGGR